MIGRGELARILGDLNQDSPDTVHLIEYILGLEKRVEELEVEPLHPCDCWRCE